MICLGKSIQAIQNDTGTQFQFHSYHGYSVSGQSSQQCGGIPLKLLCVCFLIHHKNFSRQSVIKVPNQ